MSYSIGSVKKVIGKDGKERYEGFIGRSPVTGFLGVKDNNQNVIYFSLDYKKAEYLDKQGKGEEDNKPQEEVKEQ